MGVKIISKEVMDRQLATMISLQNEHCYCLDENWLDSKIDWYPSILIESAKALEAVGINWFHENGNDVHTLSDCVSQIFMSMLSSSINENRHVFLTTSFRKNIITAFEEGYLDDGKPLKSDLIALTGLAADKLKSYNRFAKIIFKLSSSWENLYSNHLANACLMKFRITNKVNYISNWTYALLADEANCTKQTLTDADHLFDIMKLVNINDDDIVDKIMGMLKVRYGEAVKNLSKVNAV